MLRLKGLGLAGFWLRYMKNKAKWQTLLLYSRSFRYNLLQYIITGSNSLYCVYFGASWVGFSVITSPNPNLSGWNLEYKWGAMVCTQTRKIWEIAPGVPPKGAKTCFVFFCHQCNAAFWPLILHQFWPFSKLQAWIVFRMHTPVKIFGISAEGVFQVLKTAKKPYSRVRCLW